MLTFTPLDPLLLPLARRTGWTPHWWSSCGAQHSLIWPPTLDQTRIKQVTHMLTPDWCCGTHSLSIWPESWIDIILTLPLDHGSFGGDAAAVVVPRTAHAHAIPHPNQTLTEFWLVNSPYFNGTVDGCSSTHMSQRMSWFGLRHAIMTRPLLPHDRGR